MLSIRPRRSSNYGTDWRHVMSQQPLQYRRPSDELRDQLIDDSSAVRRFRRIIVTIAVSANFLMLLAILHDVFSKGQPGVHNFAALMIGALLSPAVNFALAALTLGLESAIYTNRRGWWKLLVVPVAGAVVNLVPLLLMVPWHSPQYPGP